MNTKAPASSRATLPARRPELVCPSTVAFSAADRAGLEAGDRIDSVKGERVGGLDDFSELVNGAGKGTVLLHTDNGFVAVAEEGRAG